MKAALIQQAVPGSTGTQDWTDANIASDYRLAKFFSTRAAANNTSTAHGAFCIGTVNTDGSVQGITYHAMLDNVNPSACQGGNDSALCAAIPVGNNTNPLAEAAFSSVLSNGLRLNWSDIDAAQLVNGLLVSGSDVTASLINQTLNTGSSPVTTTVTHALGTTPDVVIAESYMGGNRLGMGFYDRIGNTYACATAVNFSGNSPTVLNGVVRSDAILQQMTNATNDWTLTLTNFGATTFDAVATGSTIQADVVRFTCLKITTGIYKVGILTAPTSPGDISISGMSASPSVLMMLMSRITTVNAIDQSDAAGTFGLGIAVNNNGSTQQLACSTSSDDGATISEENCYTSNTKCVAVMSAAGAIDIEATLSSWDAGGATLSFSNTSGAVLIPYLAIAAPIAVASAWQGYWPLKHNSTLLRM